MKKKDFILIGIILVIAAAMLLVNYFFIRKTGSQVEIMVDGESYQTLDLNQEKEIVIEGVRGGTNRLVIEDGYAVVVDASCPDKLCVHQKKIHYNNEAIVCLPNKVVITVISEEQPSLDAIVN